MSEEQSATDTDLQCQPSASSGESNTEAIVSPGFATKLDGSIIDLTCGEEETGLVDRAAMPDGTAVSDGTSAEDDSPMIQEASNVNGFEMDVKNSDIVGDMIEEQVIENQSMDEPLTPATDNSFTTKSLPGSGRVTPASQSDQSLTFSSSEKSTPHRKLKISDITVRQIDYDSMSSSSGSVKNLQFPQRIGISWRKGERLEAMDYLNSWFPAKIRSINEDDMQVLIHFDGWNQRYDEWIDMSSDRIRPLVRHSERKEKRRPVKGDRRNSFTSPGNKKQLREHKVGDAVYAKWTDCKMYPAKITNIMPTGSYEVIFYDGFKKLVQPINVRPMPNDYKQKTFEINPVPEYVLKKAKMKLDSTETSGSPEEQQGPRSGEKIKTESNRESSVEKEKKQSRTKKRKLVIPGLFSELPLVGLEGVDVTPEMQIKSEPVSTQTEYSDSNKVEITEGIKQEPGTSTGPIPSLPTIPLYGPLPPKAFVVESDHNQFKCQYEGCNKGFRKEHLLDYHIKYYHIQGGGPPPPPAKRRRKTTSTCSTESDSVTGTKKSAGKKNRNFSAESVICPQDIKLEYPDTPTAETGEISTQTSPSKHTDGYPTDDFGFKQDSMEESSVTDAEDYLKPDELVNCICDFQEENGLMIQCEVCMCWQHAACFGITERTLPTKTYVCFVCENPPGVRDSSRYIHEQDWFKTGEIASFNFLPLPPMSEERCSTVKSTHTLVAEIHKLNMVLHSLRLQLKILRTKDESKLKQWRVDWDVMESETVESFPQADESLSGKTEEKVVEEELLQKIKEESKDDEMEVDIKTEINGDKDQTCENFENDIDVKNEKELSVTEEIKSEEGNTTSDTDTKTNEVRDNIQNTAVGPTVDIETPTVKLENGTDVKQECTEKLEQYEPEECNHSDSTESVVEDPIEVCEKNLLSHILRVQSEISERFDKIEEQIEMLEAMEAMQSRRDPPTPANVFNDMPQLKRSLRNMEKDLYKVKKMSVFH